MSCSKTQLISLSVLLTSFTLFGQVDVGAETRGKPRIAEPVRAIAKSNNQFAFDLYREFSSRDGNLFFSPLSISTAMAMAYSGAKGETEKEIASALRFKLSQDQIHPAFASLMTTLNETKKDASRLRLANRLWGQKGYGFLPSFLATTRKEYGAELAQVDFISEADLARQEINSWVEEQTNNKIQNLIPPGALNELTRLVLTNAIYFKGKWVHPFEKKLTKPAPFQTSGDGKVEAPLMFQKEKFKYGENAELQFLELPYEGGNLSMLVLLPKKADGLKTLEKNLTTDNLGKWLLLMRSVQVRTYLPRFKLEVTSPLNSALSNLGMPLAFNAEKANFAGMNGKQDLFINAALHKAFVDVNEEGTEAAAATGITFGVTSAPARPKEFRVDHPFLFLIIEKQTGSILFMGRVINPKA